MEKKASLSQIEWRLKKTGETSDSRGRTLWKYVFAPSQFTRTNLIFLFSRKTQPIKNKNIILKRFTPSEISPELLAKMEAFLKEVQPDLPDNHLAKNHLHKKNIELFVFFLNEEIVAITSFTGHWTKHPSNGKKVFVAMGGLTYKKPVEGLRKVTKTVSRIYMKKHLGPLWLFKPFIGMITTVNPKLYGQFQNFFEEKYPNKSTKTPENIRAFSEETLGILEGHETTLNENLVTADDPRYPDLSDITEEYAQLYDSNSERLNNFFIENGVHVVKDDKIYLSSKAALTVGFYKPGRGLLRALKK